MIGAICRFLGHMSQCRRDLWGSLLSPRCGPHMLSFEKEARVFMLLNSKPEMVTHTGQECAPQSWGWKSNMKPLTGGGSGGGLAPASKRVTRWRILRRAKAVGSRGRGDGRSGFLQ